MKFSTMSYTFSRQREHFDLARMLEFTREYMDGIDFVTLHGQEPRALRQLADDAGVRTVCHTFFASNLPSADPGERLAAVDICRQGIEAAVILGAPAVMIPTPGVDGVDRDELRRRWIDGLAAVIGIADDAGVALSIENFPGAVSPFVTAADFHEAKVAVPGLKLTYDNGNAAGGEEPAASFTACAADVVHVHFKDWDIVQAPTEGFRPMLDGRYFRSALIGEGNIDHRACLRAMKTAGYDGYINIEYENNVYDPYEATRRAVDYLRELLAEL